MTAKEVMQNVITLKDGTEVPADDFWLYVPTWFIENAERRGLVEAIPHEHNANLSAQRKDTGTNA